MKFIKINRISNKETILNCKKIISIMPNLNGDYDIEYIRYKGSALTVTVNEEEYNRIKRRLDNSNMLIN